MNWEERFASFLRCKFADITEYVEQEHPEYFETLEHQVEVNMNYLDIKMAFYQKFFPEYIPVSKNDKPKNIMADWLKDRKKEKAKKK